jgi:AraC-like DNA-binding protein
MDKNPEGIEPFGRDRIILDYSKGGPVRHFTLLGRLNYPQARRGLLPHAHKDTMEICYLSRGRQTYVVGDRPYRLTGGDVFVTFPDETHGTGVLPEEKSILYWVWINLKKTALPFLDCTPQQARRLLSGLKGITKRLFRPRSRLKPLLDEIILLHHGKSEHRDLLIRNRITEFLIRIIEAEKESRPTVSERIRAVAAHIDVRLSSPLPLPALAGMAGLSLSRFKQRFRSEMGVPPREYILRKKVERACALLGETKKSVTEIAYELDFSSSQYFATVFKRITGKKPGEQRSRIRPGPS